MNTHERLDRIDLGLIWLGICGSAFCVSALARNDKALEQRIEALEAEHAATRAAIEDRLGPIFTATHSNKDTEEVLERD